LCFNGLDLQCVSFRKTRDADVSGNREIRCKIGKISQFLRPGFAAFPESVRYVPARNDLWIKVFIFEPGTGFSATDESGNRFATVKRRNVKNHRDWLI
ncbi:hypothetical protein, partial [Alistipes ihumii]|uniref:hypothetical protein n=1 Tax=Alistipes ihumii TaxID=1470347 RepID=UPI003AB00C98